MDVKLLVPLNFLYYYILFLKLTLVLLSAVDMDTRLGYVNKTTKYGRIRGFVSERLPGYRVEQFLGVPFAAPPVKNLRFERPIEPTPWSELRDTLVIPPACLQKESMDYIHQHVPNFNSEDEDCLYLNLYKPEKQSKMGYPVLLFIHGGSNEVGMGAMFDGDVLAGYSDIIVITFNYRLGALGFYGARDEYLEGNYGFLDQIMVMKWIQNNIRYFDGDPSKVTIDGHSAGAADVGFHIISPLAKGLFRYAVMQSGSPLAFWATSRPEWRKGYNINEWEILSPGTTKLKEYLKTLDKKAIKEMKGKVNPASIISFPAVVDEHFLLERPLDTYKQGKMNGESYLMSFTKDEGSEHAKLLMEHYKVDKFEERHLRDVLKEFGPTLFPTICGIIEIILHEYGHWEHDALDNHKTIKRYIEMETDFVFVAPMINLADIISNFTENLFLFSFDHVSDLAPGPEWLGVPHGRDMFYQFGAPLVGHELFQYSEHDKAASRLMMTVWGNYVKYGKLTIDGVSHHPPYRRDTKVFNRLFSKSNNVTIKDFKNFKPRKMAFWNSFLPQIKCQHKIPECQSSISDSIVPQFSIVTVSLLVGVVSIIM